MAAENAGHTFGGTRGTCKYDGACERWLKSRKPVGKAIRDADQEERLDAEHLVDAVKLWQERKTAEQANSRRTRHLR